MDKKAALETLYDVIIIGAGPAGLTASIYTSRARLKTLVFESMRVSSQVVLTERIENYPGFPKGIDGFELMDKFRKQSESFGTEFIPEEIQVVEEDKEAGGYKVITREGDEYKAAAVIVASGAKPGKLGVKGEDEFCGKGVSYCATCDGAFFKNKHIVVIGGGNAAAEETLFLTKFAKKITLVHRRDRLRAAKILQERIFANKKIEVSWNSRPVEFLGESKIEAVRIENVKTRENMDVSCEGVFIFVGYTPNTDFLKNFVLLDDKGYVTIDKQMAANRQGIFACGDCCNKKLFQIVTACGEGALAAFSAQHYVEKLKGTAYE